MNVQVNEYANRMWADELHRFDVQRIEIRSDRASRLIGILRADTPDAVKVNPRPQEPSFDVIIPAGLSDAALHRVMADLFYKLKAGESLVGLDYTPASMPVPAQSQVNWGGLLCFGLGVLAITTIAGSRN